MMIPSCMLRTKVRDFDKTEEIFDRTECMNFLIKDQKILINIMKFGEKVSNIIKKKKLMQNLYIIKNIYKLKKLINTKEGDE